MPSQWSPEREQLLIQLHNKELLNPDQIRERFAKLGIEITKNAIIGKLFRNKNPSRASDYHAAKAPRVHMTPILKTVLKYNPPLETKEPPTIQIKFAPAIRRNGKTMPQVNKDIELYEWCCGLNSSHCGDKVYRWPDSNYAPNERGGWHYTWGNSAADILASLIRIQVGPVALEEMVWQ